MEFIKTTEKTRKDMIKLVADRLGYTQKDVTKVIDTYFDIVIEAIAASENVSLGKLGKIKLAKTAEREGWDVKNQKPMTIPAHTIVKYSASTNVKAAITAINK